jgi:hypothetical protein
LGYSAGVSASDTQYDFTLGLKDKALRSRAGAEALEARLYKRLQAAGLHSFRISVDGARGEVRIKLSTDFPAQMIRDLLVQRSVVEVLPVAQGVDVLEDLRELLPPGVTLGRSDVAGVRDTYLYSPNDATLLRYASSIALGDFRVLVGPAQHGGAGSRTWLVERGAKGVVGGADAISIDSGAHPNYHYLTAWWKDLPVRRAKERWLVVVDDRVVMEFAGASVADDGRLTVRMPAGPAARQLERAQWLAGRLASPHPCDVVIVAQSATHTK